ncbi:MAG TPA: peptidase M28, partial [Thermoanaerobaculia bacterium]
MPPIRALLALLAGLCLSAFPALAAAAPAATAAPAAAGEAKAIVTELVACGTRNSLSSWTDPKRGIGCGRDAVVKRFGEIAAKSGGRLKVIV